MDAFVIRKPKGSGGSRSDSAASGSAAALLAFNDPNRYVVKAAKPRGALNLIPKARGQRKLSDLSGVVNLDQLETAVIQLQDPDLSEAEKVRVLKSLRHKKPATEIIRSSGIGKTVRRLTEDSNTGAAEVRAEALKVYKAWKEVVEDRVEKKAKAKHIEVECDEGTRQARATTVSLMKQAVCKGQSIKTFSKVTSVILNEIERSLFKSCGNLMNKSYRRTARKIVFALGASTVATVNPQQQPLPQLDEVQAFVDKYLKS